MKKVKVLALVMVFAFAALGGAYAMWYDTLFIDESIDTGVVNLTWTCANSSDSGFNYEKTGGVYNGNKDRLDRWNGNEAKNVGSKNVKICNDTEELPEICGQDTRHINDMLKIDLYNGYPGYQEYIETKVKNNGTVPTKFEVKLSDPSKKIPDWMHLQIIDNKGNVLYDNKDKCKTGLEGMQIDPGETVGLKIVERVLQCAPQNATTSFVLELKGVQWNEYKFNLPNQITKPI
ncbi:MAG: hypothetical protein ACOX6I_10715 [Syntrophomonadaceae bacterium]|jgi:hypothetical protein